MKVIDLLNKIANGEIENYNTIIKLENEQLTVGILLGSYIFDKKRLNDEIEILEDEEEFEDIEELYNCLAKTDNEIEKILIQNINDLSEKINQLIRNQKKIIERLNEK